MGLASQAIANRSQNWWHLSSIQLAGGIISTPLIAMGSTILFANGLVNAIFSIVLGNLIIFFISICIVHMSFHNRLNAIENAEQFVGKRGGRVLAFFVLITMIGWLPRQLFPGTELLQIFPVFSIFNIGSVLGGLASLLLLFGIKGLKKLCTYSIIPLIVLFFIILGIVGLTQNKIDLSFPNHFDFSGTSLVVSSLIASIVDYPTFFRHSKSKRDSFIALVIILLVTIIIQCFGLFLYNILDPNSNFLSELARQGFVPAICLSAFLIISVITSASWNIYAASVGWESLFPQFKDKTEYAVIGLTATLLFTAFYIKEFLLPINEICDTIISGIAGVLVFEYLRKIFLRERALSSEIIYNILSWWIGGAIGVIIYFREGLHHYATFISVVIGFGVILTIIQLRKINRKIMRRM